ncbi:ArsR/SmtB family transcription factor [Ilumatobacter sp.]|uniref:ArsR/SmtB family transcription factor n=1 Tax=Ilumatobacter sp. TaxID=1967498 RepID=UPI003C4ED918
MYSEALDDQGFRAVAHPDRRVLLRLMGSDEHPVGHLASAAELAQPIVSQHLKVLREAGLVSVRRDGNRRLYSLDFERVGALRSVLDEFWHDRLSALKYVAERDSVGRTGPVTAGGGGGAGA